MYTITLLNNIYVNRHKGTVALQPYEDCYAIVLEGLDLLGFDLLGFDLLGLDLLGGVGGTSCGCVYLLRKTHTRVYIFFKKTESKGYGKSIYGRFF